MTDSTSAIKTPDDDLPSNPLAWVRRQLKEAGRLCIEDTLGTKWYLRESEDGLEWMQERWHDGWQPTNSTEVAAVLASDSTVTAVDEVPANV